MKGSHSHHTHTYTHIHFIYILYTSNILLPRPVAKPSLNTVKQLYSSLKDTILKPSGSPCELSVSNKYQLVFIFAQALSTLIAGLKDDELIEVLVLDDLMAVLR